MTLIVNQITIWIAVTIPLMNNNQIVVWLNTLSNDDIIFDLFFICYINILAIRRNNCQFDISATIVIFKPFFR